MTPAAPLSDPLARRPGWTRLGDLRALGNRVYRVEAEGGTRVLKVYRERRGALQVRASDLSQRLVERKTGTGARARWRTERGLLALWREHGVDVPAVLEGALPEEAGPFALWLEDCAGPLLSERVRDPGLAWDERLAEIERLGADQGARHARAVALGEVRLLQEHATLNHVLAHGERRVAFDLETTWRASVPPTVALAQELGGTLRSLWRAVGERFDEGLAAWTRGHARPELLREAAGRAVRSRAPGAVVRRLQDRARRGGEGGKTWVLERLLLVL